jgi:hypothetical protein
MENAMNIQIREHSTAKPRKLPFEYVALVLQGGGALGAYQEARVFTFDLHADGRE